MGFKSMKMGWDICSSPPWVTFYPYTMFQNPISWPSHNKCRETIIIQKVLVTQSCNIVHCNLHTQKPICEDLQVFANTFPLCKFKVFFSLLSGRVQETAKISHFVDFDWENALKLLEWCIFKVWECQIQYCRFWAVISGSKKITISDKKSMALVASPYDPIGSCFDNLLSSSRKKSQFQAKISHFVDFDWENHALKWLEWCIFRVWGMPNPMVTLLQVPMIIGSKNYNFRINFTFCWFWPGKNALKWLEWCSKGEAC